MSKMISIPTLCELYSKDPSQIRGMLSKLGITKQKVRRKEDNKIVTVITDDDHQKLVDHFDNLTSKNAGKNYIAMSEAMTKLGYPNDQHTNFKRTCETYGVTVKKLRVNNRTQSCITKAGFKKLEKIRKAITIQDID